MFVSQVLQERLEPVVESEFPEALQVVDHFNNRPRLDRYDDGYFLDYL